MSRVENLLASKITFRYYETWLARVGVETA